MTLLALLVDEVVKFVEYGSELLLTQQPLLLQFYIAINQRLLIIIVMNQILPAIRPLAQDLGDDLEVSVQLEGVDDILVVVVKLVGREGVVDELGLELTVLGYLATQILLLDGGATALLADRSPI